MTAGASNDRLLQSPDHFKCAGLNSWHQCSSSCPSMRCIQGQCRTSHRISSEWATFRLQVHLDELCRVAVVFIAAAAPCSGSHLPSPFCRATLLADTLSTTLSKQGQTPVPSSAPQGDWVFHSRCGMLQVSSNAPEASCLIEAI
jgi:hypothetical protein